MSGQLYGVNVAGAEFAHETLPGTIDVTYTYASDPQRFIDFVTRRQLLFRIPFLWERIQRTPFAALSAPDLAGIQAMVDAATGAGGKVILDLHNYARYNGTPLVAGDAASFADVWSRLATQFQGHPGVYGYEIMNEPHDLANGTIWPTLAQAATDAIRLVDTQTKIIIPGDDWSTAAFWRDNNEDLAITDPASNLIYAAHQYFDPDHSGTYGAPYSTYPSIGIERVQPFVAWLQEHGHQGILTEYGVPPTTDWTTVLDSFMTYISGIPEIVGGTAWAAGPWWGSYALSLEYPSIPANPQMAILARYPIVTGGSGGMETFTQFLPLTRREIRQRIGSLMDRVTVGPALGGTASSFVLEQIKRYPDHHFAGRVAYVVSGAATGQMRVITASEQHDGVAFVEPAFTTPIMAGAEIEIWDEDLHPDRVNLAINLAILDAQEFTQVQVRANPEAITTDRLELDAPDTLAKLFGVSYRLSGQAPMVYQHVDPLWIAEHRSAWTLIGRSVYLTPSIPETASLADIWLDGYRPAVELTSDSQVCEIRPDYVMYMAAFFLESGEVGSPVTDPTQHAPRAAGWLRQGLMVRERMLTSYEPNTVEIGP